MRYVALERGGIGVLRGDEIVSLAAVDGLEKFRGYPWINGPEDLVKAGLLAEVDGILQEALAGVEALGPVTAEQLACPVKEPAHMLFIGLNYADHADEIGVAPPARPHVFSKLRGSLNGPSGSIRARAAVSSLDYEVELGVVIGAPLRHASPSDVRAAIAGFVVVNDFSARDWQFAPDAQLTIGKGFEGFCSVGPALVTPDLVPEIDRAAISCTVNGAVVQSSSTAQLLFGVDEAIAFLSSVVQLLPGDLVSTGTPGGVQQGKAEPRWLQPGDVVESTIEGLGTLRNTIVPE